MTRVVRGHEYIYWSKDEQNQMPHQTVDLLNLRTSFLALTPCITRFFFSSAAPLAWPSLPLSSHAPYPSSPQAQHGISFSTKARPTWLLSRQLQVKLLTSISSTSPKQMTRPLSKSSPRRSKSSATSALGLAKTGVKMLHSSVRAIMVRN